jgi:hypothetical protein
MNKSAFRGRLGVRPDYPTLRKEREGWGTRQLVEGIEPKGAFLLPSHLLPASEFAQKRDLGHPLKAGGRSFYFDRA